jgi:hypothetical protein
MHELNVAFAILSVLFILLAAILVSFSVFEKQNEQRNRNTQEKTSALGSKWK